VEQAEDDDRREAKASRGEISLKPRPWPATPLRAEAESRQRSHPLNDRHRQQAEVGSAEAQACRPSRHAAPEAPAPANDDRKVGDHPVPDRKQATRLREQRREAEDVEVSPETKDLVWRMMHPGGALPPK